MKFIDHFIHFSILLVTTTLLSILLNNTVVLVGAVIASVIQEAQGGTSGDGNFHAGSLVADILGILTGFGTAYLLNV